jgi:hypothetical protein
LEPAKIHEIARGGDRIVLEQLGVSMRDQEDAERKANEGVPQRRQDFVEPGQPRHEQFLAVHIGFHESSHQQSTGAHPDHRDKGAWVAGLQTDPNTAISRDFASFA